MAYRLLIVDDEKEVTSSLKTTLAERGHKVLVTNSGEEARKIIFRKSLDLILLDIEMPGISGIEVLRFIKDKHPETKVIVITGHPEYERHAKSFGCDAFITKPVSVGTLTTTINELLSD